VSPSISLLAWWNILNSQPDPFDTLLPLQ